MLVAARPMSIGDFQLAIGDPITRDHEEVLPPGRLHRLQVAGWVRDTLEESKNDENLETRVIDLEERVEQLEQLLRATKTRATRAPEAKE